MITTHFHMELADGPVKRNVSVLFVHIMDASSGLVSEDNTESLDMVWSAFEDLVDGKDLSLSALSLELPSEVVPKFGFSNYIIACEESNSVDFRVRI